MKMIIKNIIFIIVFVIVSCEDKVNVSLKDAPPIIVIDAWVNNLKQEQTITITRSQSYYDNSLPKGVGGATVQIINSSKKIINFSYSGNSGKYVWNPNSDPSYFGSIGEKYQLIVTLSDGKKFVSQSQINRVPPIDSIKYTFKEKKAFQKEGYYGEFLATDLKGTGDAYWIKSYKNGKYLNKPFELNYAFDAGFSPGGNVDGVVFIQPIQSRVNELDKDRRPIPYKKGDSLNVQIHSITHQAYDFLLQVRIQTQRDGGFDEIFAEPFRNVSTNIKSTNTSEPVAGFFCVSAVSTRGRKLE